jgi:hypothetical protein
METIWLGYLRRQRRNDLSIGQGYFRNFIKHHPRFQFSIVKIFDGTSHLMVDKQQYQMMRRELENKTGATLPEYNHPSDINDPRFAMEGTRVYANQREFSDHSQKLLNHINMAHER